MGGALERIKLLKKYLSDPNLSAEMRKAVETELGETSRLLDNAEHILGEHVTLSTRPGIQNFAVLAMAEVSVGY